MLCKWNNAVKTTLRMKIVMFLSYQYFFWYPLFSQTAIELHKFNPTNIWTSSLFMMWYHETIVTPIIPLLLDKRFRCTSFFFQTRTAVCVFVYFCREMNPVGKIMDHYLENKLLTEGKVFIVGWSQRIFSCSLCHV